MRVERKIQTLKRYCRLNSTLTRGPGTKWFYVVNASVTAINRIHQEKGGAPEQIILMDLQQRNAVNEKQSDLRKKAQDRLAFKPRSNEPSVGDTVRTRIPSESKLPMDYKGHIAYKFGVPIKWSDKLHRIEKKRVSKELGTVRVLVNGRWRFWPSEVQACPENTNVSEVWGQDGNADYKQQRRGIRRSKRVQARVLNAQR